MDFALTEEQQLIVTTTREFVRRELVPHEREVEESGRLREELRQELRARAIAAGLYAANMPAEVGGAGLDAVSWMLYEKELGYTGYVLHYACVARPSNILLACQGAQRERYLLPAVRGERTECLAMRSEEHTSELQSQSNLVCRLLLEKKKNTKSRGALPSIATCNPHDTTSVARE